MWASSGARPPQEHTAHPTRCSPTRAAALPRRRPRCLPVLSAAGGRRSRRLHPAPCLVAGVTILLSLTVFLNLVAAMMPNTSDAVPLIGMLPGARRVTDWLLVGRPRPCRRSLFRSGPLVTLSGVGSTLSLHCLDVSDDAWCVEMDIRRPCSSGNSRILHLSVWFSAKWNCLVAASSLVWAGS